MDDRIHAALDAAPDGDERPADLTPAEARELEQLAVLTRMASDHLRSHRSPGVVDAVMREVSAAYVGRAGGGAAGGGGLALLLEPRTLTIRPIWGLLAAAALAGVMLVPALRPGSLDSSGQAGTSGLSSGAAVGGEAATSAQAATVFVQFRLHAPEASEVRLAGSFTGWEPRHALHRSEGGVWTVMVAMEPGIHDYAFVVDGADWRIDPSAPRVDDGFGGENSRLALLLGNGMRES